MSVHHSVQAAGVGHAPLSPSRALRAALSEGFGDAPRVVLAVSGGLDSMVLLSAAARWRAPSLAAVATFDHGTGPAAAAGSRMAAERARALGFAVVEGRAARPARDEAGWRRQRWEFLRNVARELDGAIATAHTRDDQLETVVMRVLRGAGARGLAGLAATSQVLRPLLGVSRAVVAAYASRHGVRWVEDPSNESRAHLRNRVRLDLLPAIVRLQPHFPAEMLELGERAAAWRREVEELAGGLGELGPGRELRVSAAPLVGIANAGLDVLWPALASSCGVTLDRRGTRRLTEFTISGRTNGTIPLSGGAEVVRRRGEFVIRGRRGHTSSSGDELQSAEQPLDGEERRVGRWRLVPVDGETVSESGSECDLWRARLPVGRRLAVRPWRAGDRVRGGGGVAARRVKRFFKDGGIAGVDRAGWPVVLLDGDIVWIPGLRRTVAASVPSGRPGLRYACLEVRERDNS